MEQRQLQHARRPGAQHTRGRALAGALPVAAAHGESQCLRVVGLRLLLLRPPRRLRLGLRGERGEGRVDDGVAHGFYGWLDGLGVLLLELFLLARTNVEGRRRLPVVGVGQGERDRIHLDGSGRSIDRPRTHSAACGLGKKEAAVAHAHAQHEGGGPFPKFKRPKEEAQQGKKSTHRKKAKRRSRIESAARKGPIHNQIVLNLPTDRCIGLSVKFRGCRIRSIESIKGSCHSECESTEG